MNHNFLIEGSIMFIQLIALRTPYVWLEGAFSCKEESEKLTIVRKCIDFCRVRFNWGSGPQSNRLELP